MRIKRTQWDEIDIEFLGKNTNEVQFNTFTNGVSSGGHLCQLGFDASESFHQYGFDWSSDSITWYVDGNAVYTLSNKAAAIPVTPGRIMANVWNGKTSATKYWLNEYDGKTPLTAYYDYISWNPFSNTSSTVSSTDETVSAGDASSTAVTVPAEDASSAAVTVSSKVSSTTWKADDSIPQYTLENVYGLLRVTKSVSQTIPYAAFSGSFENTVSVPDDLSFQIKFINGFKLALKVFLINSDNDAIPVYTNTFSRSEKGQHDIDIPITGISDEIKGIRFMINSDPSQVTLPSEAYCKAYIKDVVIKGVK